MYGLCTIKKLNDAAAEAARILDKHPDTRPERRPLTGGSVWVPENGKLVQHTWDGDAHPDKPPVSKECPSAHAAIQTYADWQLVEACDAE